MAIFGVSIIKLLPRTLTHLTLDWDVDWDSIGTESYRLEEMKEVASLWPPHLTNAQFRARKRRTTRLFDPVCTFFGAVPRTLTKIDILGTIFFGDAFCNFSDLPASLTDLTASVDSSFEWSFDDFPPQLTRLNLEVYRYESIGRLYVLPLSFLQLDLLHMWDENKPPALPPLPSKLCVLRGVLLSLSSISSLPSTLTELQMTHLTGNNDVIVKGTRRLISESARSLKQAFEPLSNLRELAFPITSIFKGLAIGGVPRSLTSLDMALDEWNDEIMSFVPQNLRIFRLQPEFDKSKATYEGYKR